MPQEQYDDNSKEYNTKIFKLGKLNKKYDCNNKYNCHNCYDCNFKFNTTPTHTVDGNVKNESQEVKEILLTNISNNTNLNTFLLPLPLSAITTTATPIIIQNANDNCYVYQASDMDSGVILSSSPKPSRNFLVLNAEQCCSINSDSKSSSTTYDGGGGSSCDGNNFCHNTNKNSGYNNNVFLNTNNFVTVQCALSACENECEQNKRKQKQSGYEKDLNTVAASTTAITTVAEAMAELPNVIRENEFYAHILNSEQKVENQIGNLSDNTSKMASFESPVDHVLENFEKFLNSVKLENQSLNKNVPECDDLINLSEDCSNDLNFSKANVMQCKGDEGEIFESVGLIHKLENINSNQVNKYKNMSELKVYNNNTLTNTCDFQNLIYCDLNETLEEQNLLEDKEIRHLTETELTSLTLQQHQKPVHQLNGIEIMRDSTLNEIIMRAEDISSVSDGSSGNNRNFKTENETILKVAEGNEMIQKTPVTCINVSSYYSNNNSLANNNENSKYNSKCKEHHETCAVLFGYDETCQNKDNNCKVTSITEKITPITATKMCSSPSNEKISPHNHCQHHCIKKIINQSQFQNQSIKTNTNTASVTATDTVSKTCSTAKIHHTGIVEQEREQRSLQDQFTSAYTLRDFAKSLKPSLDEDIIYTLNFSHKNIEKTKNQIENLQKIQLNQQTQKENLSPVQKESINKLEEKICDSSKKQVNDSENQKKVNENILYNNSEDDLKANGNGLNKTNLQTFLTNLETSEIQYESATNCKSFTKKSKNLQIANLKDTQFLEIHDNNNLATPKFFSLDTQKSDSDFKTGIGGKLEKSKFLLVQKIPDNIEHLHKTKFDCNEKIYTRETNSPQTLLYLTFLWPTIEPTTTKNEGQVVTTTTTRQQGNIDQGEKKIISEQENNSNSSNKKNIVDECKFEKRTTALTEAETYGTCSKKDIDKGQAKKAIKRVDQIIYHQNNGDLFEQNINIDKQSSEFKNQSLQKSKTQLIGKSIKVKNELKEENLSCIVTNLKSQNHIKEIENEKCYDFNENNLKCTAKCESESSLNHRKQQLLSEKYFQSSEKCVLHSKVASENSRFIQKITADDIKSNNLDLKNELESVCQTEDNVNRILNLNTGIKNLSRTQETNQNITTNKNNSNNNCEIAITTINHQSYIPYKQHTDLIDIEQLNLEEFEASQRLKRLLQLHQQICTRTLPNTTISDKQSNAIITPTSATTKGESAQESLKTIIARHLKEIPKGNPFITNKQEKNDEVINSITNTSPITTIPTELLNTITTTKTKTTATKANKLQADCETTLERSPLLHENENEQKRNVTEIYENKNDSKANLKLDDKEDINKINEKVEVKTKDTKAKQNENRSSPLACVSQKVVRLSEQQQQQQKLISYPLTEITDIKENQHKEEEEEAYLIAFKNSPVLSANVKFPGVYGEIIDKTEISQTTSPSKQRCNLNLQHIVKTKQLLLKQKQQQEEYLENNNFINKNSFPPQPSPSSLFSTTNSEFNDYKSAFVPTRPEVYKSIKPLTGIVGNLQTKTKSTASHEQTATLIPSIIPVGILSEFDTQRFSNFLYLNDIKTSFHNNYNRNENINSDNYQTVETHVLPNQNQQQQQQYPLYTKNFVDTIQLPYCYDELINDVQQEHDCNCITPTVTVTTATSLLPDNNKLELENDLTSISSTNSSLCECINCQQEQQQNKQKIDRDKLYEVDTKSVLSIASQPFLNEDEEQETFKMREVNGQLRGLLKKPNRPPPTRKNRVVFDETRNEFFEADYIILIREDCAYDEEDEEPCTCGEHELVRLCCEEGCQCNYSTAPATTDDNRTPQSPKFAPPIEFVDEAALSPPDGYKDNGLKNTLGGALSGHIFGAQHLQQLQVIQRLQQQRAAMLAARNSSQIPPPPPLATTAASGNQQSSTATAPSSSPSPTAAAAVPSTASSINQNEGVTQQHSPDDDAQGVCTECAECAECAAKQLQQDTECNTQCQEDLTASLGVPAVALLPIHTSSPERRMTQKEIIAGEERPRYVLQAQYKSSPVKNRKDPSKIKNNKFINVQKANNQRYVVETITMTTTTVTERRILREATEDLAATTATGTPVATLTPSTTLSSTGGDNNDFLPPALPAKPGAVSLNNDSSDSEKPPPIPPKESSPTTQISGILKGGKLWKQDSISQQSDDQNNTTSEDEAGSISNAAIKRSVRFVTEEISNDDVDGQSSNVDEDNQINELIPIKKHSTLFKNALRPNSAMQQLFPSTVSHQTLTSEALRAFDESKRAGCLVSTLPGSAGDSDTLRRSMERNILRRSLIKKKVVKSDISLEERIKQLTCGIDEDNDDSTQENGDEDNSKIEDNGDLSHRDSPAGEENPQKFSSNGNNSDKSFSPNSSVSSSSSSSSAYKKITEIFNREKKGQEKIMEIEENPIVIIPQECRCPAAPDLGMGVQVPVVHTQIHRTPPRQTEPKRQFLSTLAPLTACVAGNKDDLSSYYTLAAAHHNQTAQNAHAAEYNLAVMMAGEQNTTGMSQSTDEEMRKVAPDVIAGTPGQEQQDELAAFAQQEANRTDKIKKRYGSDSSNSKENKDANSDDDEGNDYGFNKRPSVRGIKPKFSSTNEILQQMQDQLSQQMPSVAHSQPLPQPMKSYTLPKQCNTNAISKQLSQQQPSPQNVPHPTVAATQQQLPQQQQICSAVATPASVQIPASAAISQQQTEQRTWSFYSETAGAGEQQRLPVESAAAAAMQQAYYQTLPAGAMFRHTMIHQHQQHGQEEAMLYAQNCQAMASAIEPQPHYGHYARSPTRRPESPPPLRNYHQTMVLIPYNAETYSQFAATSLDPKMAHLQRQNILEYQQVGEMTQVTQQTIRVPIGYALPGMQLHVVAGRGHATQYAAAATGQTHHHQHQRIMTQRYQFAQDASMAGFSERGVPEGAAAVSHTDCSGSGMISPTTGQQIAMQQQLQQGAQTIQQQQQVNCQQQQQQPQQQQQLQPQTQSQNNMQSTAPQGSVYYAMNV